MPKYNPKIVLAYFTECGLPAPVLEFRFHPDRKFQFDFAWPDHKVALEIEGGIWTRGAHGRGSGIKRDMEKYNLAASNGWFVLRCVPDELCMAETVQMVQDTIRAANGLGEV